MRVAVALLCLIVIIVGTTADSTKDEKSGISRVMRGVRNGNSAKKKPQEKVGGKRTRKPRRKIKSKGRKVGSKRPGNRRGGKRGGKRSNKNPGRKAAAKKSTKKRGKVSKSKSVKKTNRGNQPRTSGTSRQALKGNDCDYIDLGAITTAGTGCATNGVKFVIKGNSGVRKQFLYVDGKVIIALTKLKFAECTAFTDITSQVNCKAVAGLDVVSLVGTNTPATPGATTSSSSSGSTIAVSTRCLCGTRRTVRRRGRVLRKRQSDSGGIEDDGINDDGINDSDGGFSDYRSDESIYGESTEYHEYPWSGIIANPSGTVASYGCGASLVADVWAVTAAHCVNTVTAGAISVVFGDYDKFDDSFELEQNDDNYIRRQVIPVSQIFLHPEFGVGGTYFNDIALLKLTNTLDIAVFPTACLPSTGDYTKFVGKSGPVVGFKSSNILLENNQTVLSSDDCSKAHRVRDGIFCAGGITGQTACQADDGGPLNIPDDITQRFNLAGSFSYGQGCDSSSPGVYVDISFYRAWIDATILANGGGTTCS